MDMTVEQKIAAVKDGLLTYIKTSQQSSLRQRFFTIIETKNAHIYRSLLDNLDNPAVKALVINALLNNNRLPALQKIAVKSLGYHSLDFKNDLQYAQSDFKPAVEAMLKTSDKTAPDAEKFIQVINNYALTGKDTGIKEFLNWGKSSASSLRL
jgi:hypothetical protein